MVEDGRGGWLPGVAPWHSGEAGTPYAMARALSAMAGNLYADIGVGVVVRRMAKLAAVWYSGCFALSCSRISGQRPSSSTADVIARRLGMLMHWSPCTWYAHALVPMHLVCSCIGPHALGTHALVAMQWPGGAAPVIDRSLLAAQPPSEQAPLHKTLDSTRHLTGTTAAGRKVGRRRPSSSGMGPK